MLRLRYVTTSEKAGVQRVDAPGCGPQTMLGTLTRGRYLDGCYGNTATIAQTSAPSHTDKKPVE